VSSLWAGWRTADRIRRAMREAIIRVGRPWGARCEGRGAVQHRTGDLGPAGEEWQRCRWCTVP
jgi:hypothetical protein